VYHFLSPMVITTISLPRPTRLAPTHARWEQFMYHRLASCPPTDFIAANARSRNKPPALAKAPGFGMPGWAK